MLIPGFCVFCFMALPPFLSPFPRLRLRSSHRAEAPLGLREPGRGQTAHHLPSCGGSRDGPVKGDGPTFWKVFILQRTLFLVAMPGAPKRSVRSLLVWPGTPCSFLFLVDFYAISYHLLPLLRTSYDPFIVLICGVFTSKRLRISREDPRRRVSTPSPFRSNRSNAVAEKRGMTADGGPARMAVGRGVTWQWFTWFPRFSSNQPHSPNTSGVVEMLGVKPTKPRVGIARVHSSHLLLPRRRTCVLARLEKSLCSPKRTGECHHLRGPSPQPWPEGSVQWKHV